MKTLSYKKALLLFLVLGLFSSPSYASITCLKYDNSIGGAIENDHLLNFGCAKRLIRRGADVNEQGYTVLAMPYGYSRVSDGKTPLMRAVERQDKGLVALLIEKHANPFLTDNQGRTALDYAFDYSKRAGGYDSVAKEIYDMLVVHENSY